MPNRDILTPAKEPATVAEQRGLPTRVLPIMEMRQYVVDITGLQPQPAGSHVTRRKMHLLITVIDGEVTEVAPRADGDRTWGIPLPTEAVK